MQIHSPELLFYIQVAQFRSFSQAADALNIPQPTVSRKIIALENTVNQKLFHRSKSGLSLTEFGSRFLKRAVRVQTEIQSLTDLAKAESQSVPVVKVEALPGLRSLLFQRVIPEYQNDYPYVQIDLNDIQFAHREVNSDAIRLHTHSPSKIDRVEHAYLESRGGFYASPSLVERFPRLSDSEDIVRRQVPVVDVKNLKGIAPSNISRFIERCNPKAIVNDSITASEAIVNGVGIGWNLDTIMSDYIESNKVIRLFNDEIEEIIMKAYISYPTHKILSHEENAFVEYVRAFSH